MKIGLSGLVFLIFLVLKLSAIGQVATWSWWWVASPLWIYYGALLVAGVAVGIGAAFEKRSKVRR
ncbi:hypothetical protein [Burkholderia gladioli]|uniref:hypothetical protein n=1 Tax=Burkholderia gladioli TaxID=28095 RepID=UPI0016421D64|nr:hypothetical protein [Burkholderia gladioli]